MSRAESLKGKNLMVFVDGKTLALARSCNFTVTTNTEDGSTKDDGGYDNQDVVGFSWTASSDNVSTAQPGAHELTYDDLLDIQLAGTPVTLVFGVAANAGNIEVPDGGWTTPTKGRTGKAIITNVNVTAANKQNSTFTVDFAGKGPLTKIA